MRYYIILMYDEKGQRYGYTDILEEDEVPHCVTDIIEEGYKFCVIDVKDAIEHKKYFFDWRKI